MGVALTESRLSGTTWPEAAQSYPANLVPQPAGEFGSSTGWNSFPGLTIDTVDGVARWNGTSTGTSVMAINMVTPAVLGREYGILEGIKIQTAGNANPRIQSPAITTTGSGINTVGHHSRRVAATAEQTQAGMAVTPGANLEIDYLRAYDLTQMMTKKWRIVLVYSQSNWVGPGDAADRFTYDLPEPRAIVIPCKENLLRGVTLDAEGIGVPMILVDPVEYLSGNQGGGPAGAFARTFCDGLRDDEILIYAATGYSGGGRLGTGSPDGAWNRDDNGVAWANLLKQADALVARAPAGSTVAGCLFCQGEADLSINAGDTHTLAIRGDFELLRARYGQFPIVISEIGRTDRTEPTVANMVASQAKLDSNSGDALSLPLCRYIPRPADSVFVDASHYDQPTQRIRGALAATALLELNYGGAQL